MCLSLCFGPSYKAHVPECTSNVSETKHQLYWKQRYENPSPSIMITLKLNIRTCSLLRCSTYSTPSTYHICTVKNNKTKQGRSCILQRRHHIVRLPSPPNLKSKHSARFKVKYHNTLFKKPNMQLMKSSKIGKIKL